MPKATGDAGEKLYLRGFQGCRGREGRSDGTDHKDRRPDGTLADILGDILAAAGKPAHMLVRMGSGESPVEGPIPER